MKNLKDFTDAMHAAAEKWDDYDMEDLVSEMDTRFRNLGNGIDYQRESGTSLRSSKIVTDQALDLALIVAEIARRVK